MSKKVIPVIVCLVVLLGIPSARTNAGQDTGNLVFNHNHTFTEVVAYLNDVVRDHSNIARLHVIGKSYLGNDLLVLEITNEKTGKGMDKPGFWFDGNLHASEVMGAEVCLHTIQTLINGYGVIPEITDLIDTRTIYIMPKLNPDGSDHYLTRPDSMRSSVRPHDQDGDGAKDEDPGEDLNGDGYITQMRVRDPEGRMRTDKKDPRLLVRKEDGEKGDWTVYSEGIDNDSDGRYNEDGVGGLDINRNWPSRWQQEWIQRGSGLYPLSEPETRAVAEFLFAHRNVTGIVNHHMSGNFLYRPPTNRRFDPISGEEIPLPPEDEAIFQQFGRKYTEIINKQPVRTVVGRGAPPRLGAIWGVMIGWGYEHYGVPSWVPEMGSLAPFCDADNDGRASQEEMMKWNEEELGGKIFMDWKPFDHPQLGKVEIGGFINKIYNSDTKSYTNLMCYPGEIFDDFLEKHTRWNLYLVAQSPLLHIKDFAAESHGSGFYKLTLKVENRGFLPTNVTQQAILNETAQAVKAELTLDGLEIVMGKPMISLGHIPGGDIYTSEWMVKKTGRTPSVSVRIISQKGGTSSHTLYLK